MGDIGRCSRDGIIHRSRDFGSERLSHDHCDKWVTECDGIGLRSSAVLPRSERRTVICSAAAVGQTGTLGGVVYTKQSKTKIDALIDEEDYAPLAITCTSDVPIMGGMFHKATAFNQDISSWDVSSATYMGYMFYNATSFNQDLNGWCVPLITSTPTDFDTLETSWVLDRPVWGTCPSVGARRDKITFRQTPPSALHVL